METIEERARDYACHVSLDELNKEGLDAESFCGILHGYIKGATEQRQIDIEKVYHAFEKILSKEMLDNIRKILEEES